MPKPKMRRVTTQSGKVIWASPELPIHTPSGTEIHQIERGGYSLVSESMAKKIEKQVTAQSFPSIPQDLLDG